MEGIDPDNVAGEELNVLQEHELQGQTSEEEDDITNTEGIIEEGTFLDKAMLAQEDHDLPTIISADNFTEDDSFTVEPPLGEDNKYMDYDDPIGMNVFFVSHLVMLTTLIYITNTLI